jgi:phage gpG-like protein
MQMIGEGLLDDVQERFRTQTAPNGLDWVGKSAATIAAYERRGQKIDYRPLYGATGELHQTDRFHYQAGPNSVEVGTNLIYAAAMQLGAAKGAFGSTSRGSPIPWGDIPARPFLGISDERRQDILDEVGEWLASIVDGAR